MYAIQRLCLSLFDLRLISYFEYGRYGGILEDWKKDPESHGGPPDGVVSQKNGTLNCSDELCFTWSFMVCYRGSAELVSIYSES